MVLVRKDEYFNVHQGYFLDIFIVHRGCFHNSPTGHLPSIHLYINTAADVSLHCRPLSYCAVFSLLQFVYCCFNLHPHNIVHVGKLFMR